MSRLPKSLAIVTAFYPPAVGGVERYSQEFARTAIGMGVKVNVITTSSTLHKPEAMIEEGINVLRIPAKHIPLGGSSFPIPTGGMKEASELLKCDVVMAHTRFFLTTPIAAALADKRIHVLDHGSGPLRSSLPFAIASMCYEHSITLALRLFRPTFYGVSSDSVRWLRRFRIRAAGVIPNGIAARSEYPQRDAASFNHPIIFFAGRLLPDKGIRELLEAIDMVAEYGPRCDFRIAGPGPLAPEVKRFADNRSYVTYLGPISPEQVAEELQRATLFVNPSYYPEGMPTIVLEAGGAALPVVSTPRGLTDVIDDGATGWLVEPRSSSALAHVLLSVLDQPEEAIRRGRALYDRIQLRFTWPAIVETFLRHVSSGAAA